MMINSHNTILQHYNALCKQPHDNNGRACSIFNLRLHHAWITGYLIQRFTKGGDHVLDLACGKGGDLVKWENAKVKSYLGVDLVEGLLEEAKRRYATHKCTFAAQFVCNDGFGSALLQDMGLEHQGNNKSFLFEEFTLKGKGHHEGFLIKDIDLRKYYPEKFSFCEKRLKNQGHQTCSFSQDLRYMLLSFYNSSLAQKLLLRTLRQHYENVFPLESSMSDQNQVGSTLMTLKLEPTNHGLFHDYQMKDSTKQSLSTNKSLQNVNYLGKKVRFVLVECNESLINKPCLGFANGIPYVKSMHFVEKRKRKKQNQSKLGYQKTIGTKHIKGMHRNSNTYTSSASKLVHDTVCKSLENVHNIESVASLIGGQGVNSEKRMMGQHFDVCSCQFALHYAWSSEERARGAIKNVSMVLKNGGYFIGTIPDAKVVLKRLQEATIPKDSSMKEINQNCEDLSFGNKLYNVKFDVVNGTRALSLAKDIENLELSQQDLTRIKERNFQEFQEKKEMKGDHLIPAAKVFPKLTKSFGIEYEFHLEGAVQHCPEWLVPLPSLVNLAHQYGLELVFAVNFEELLLAQNNYQQLLPTQKQPPIVLPFESSLSKSSPTSNELECMSLYLAFAFQKQTNSSYNSNFEG